MTSEELNSVWKIEKTLKYEKEKLENLGIVTGGLPHKYCSENQPVSKGGVGKSPHETYEVYIADTERKVSELEEKIKVAKVELLKKIDGEYEDLTERRLLMHRYANCKTFEQIAKIMNYTKMRVYQLHKKLMRGIF